MEELIESVTITGNSDTCKASITRPFSIHTAVGIEHMTPWESSSIFDIILPASSSDEKSIFISHNIKHITFQECIDVPSKRNQLESITHPSRRLFMFNSISTLLEIGEKIGFENSKALDVAKILISELGKQRKTDAIVSQTGDDELLLYRKTDHGYNNLVIDEDGDVEVLIINSVEKTSQTKTYYLENGLDYSFLANQI